jgi:hypothetical protein
MEKNKKNPCGAAPRTPQRDPRNLCLQGKWMPLTLHLALRSKSKNNTQARHTVAHTGVPRTTFSMFHNMGP